MHDLIIELIELGREALDLLPELPDQDEAAELRARWTEILERAEVEV